MFNYSGHNCSHSLLGNLSCWWVQVHTKNNLL